MLNQKIVSEWLLQNNLTHMLTVDLLWVKDRNGHEVNRICLALDRWPDPLGHAQKTTLIKIEISLFISSIFLYIISYFENLNISLRLHELSIKKRCQKIKVKTKKSIQQVATEIKIYRKICLHYHLGGHHF